MAGASIGIAGAGLLGRLLAWRLARAGHRVAVFDAAPGPQPAFDGRGAAAFSAAGMLSPLAEMEHAEPEIAALGWRSIALWRTIAVRLPRTADCDGVFAAGCFAQRGSLLLAHRGDSGTAQRVLARLARTPDQAARPLDAAALATLEPAVLGPAQAWLLPDEAQVLPGAALDGLQAGAGDAVAWHWGRPVAAVAPGRIHGADGTAAAFDTVFDVRGLGARDGAADWTASLRGVRGETVWLHAPAHGLTRPLRLLHPRHRVYVVPRGADRVLVGASEIESEDRSPVSLRSAVELMAAAHSVVPALAEARIERLDRHLRPALPDHRPHTDIAPGLVRINGLFRHGWLLAPALVEDAVPAAGLAVPPLEEHLHA